MLDRARARSAPELLNGRSSGQARQPNWTSVVFGRSLSEVALSASHSARRVDESRRVVCAVTAGGEAQRNPS